MTKRQKKLLALSIIAVFFWLLRLWHFREFLNFSADQGEGCLRLWEIWKNKEITLIGPLASPRVINRGFFQGPLIYYCQLILMLISGWDPLIASFWQIILTFTGMLLMFAVGQNIANSRAGIIAALLFAFSYPMIVFSRFIWAPNWLFLFTPLYLLVGVKALKKPKTSLFFASGLLAGINLHFHFQYVLIIFFSILYLVYRKIKIKNLLIFGTGIIIAYSPLIIFDLRNSFYNFKTILLWLKTNKGLSVELNPHYFLSFFCIIFSVAAVYLSRLKNRLFLGLILGSFICLNIRLLWQENNAFGMPKNWSYDGLLIAKQIVLKQAGPNYNIVNLLSGDTRFYSLRYLLTVAGKPPETVESYPHNTQLFIVSYENEEKTLMNTVWEIQSQGAISINRQWAILPGITLYETIKN